MVERTGAGRRHPAESACGGTEESSRAAPLPGDGGRWLRSVFGNSWEVVKVVDPDGVLRYANAAFGRHFGYDPEEAVGKMNVLDHVHPDDLPRVLEETEKALGQEEGMTSNVAEYRFRHADGSWRHVQSVGNYLLDDPHVRGVLINVRDLTERRRAEEAHEEGERRFRQLFEQALDTLLVHDEEGRMVDCNEEACRSLGYSREEMLSLSVQDFAANLSSGEGRACEGGPLWRHDAEARGFGLPAKGVYLAEHRRKDGTTFPVEVRVGHVDYGGERMMLASCRDVTEIKRAAEALKRSEERFRSLIQGASDVITVYDADGTVRYISPAIERMLGYAPEERVGTNSFDLIHPEDVDRAKGLFADVLRRPNLPVSMEVRARHKNGSWRHVEAAGTNLLEDPNVGGVVFNARDVTERRRAEDTLKESERYLRAVVGNVPVVLFAVDRDGVCTLSEGRGLKALGHRPGELVGRSLFEVYRDVPEIAANVRRTLGGEEVVDMVEVGEAVFEVFYSPLRDGGGEVVGAIGVAADVTQRQALEERLKYQVHHDALTGLPNRRLFVDRLGQALRRAARGRSRPAVLFMDLDGFKVVNDSLGHEAGDKLLVAVSERLRHCLRPEDTVARFGGDEFTVLIGDVEGPGDAARVADRIADGFKEPLRIGGQEHFARFSVGIALSDARTKGAEELLRNADTAMYWSKEEGAAYRVFDPAMHERVVKIMEAENDLKRAVEAEEFVVRYQPIVDLQTGETRGIEALVRWDHPERGLLGPSEFVAVAEENGLVVPMGEKVLGEACRWMATLQREQPRTPPLIVSVNLSARQVRRNDLAETVGRALSESGLEARCLRLEITETNYVEALAGDTDVLDRLRALGVGISIDDFGTGYSSLAYLKRLPADSLKIDGSFVAGLGEDAEDTAIVQMVIDLAHIFGMEVIAEGVENGDQAEQLKEMGCDFGQGYLFSEPLLPDEIGG